MRVKKKKIKKYLDKRWKGMLHNLDILAEILDDEAIHDLRLHSKKVKAISAILKSGSKNKNFSTKAVKPLFQQTGAIRTANLNLQIIKKYQINHKGIVNEQRKIINEAYSILHGNKSPYKKTIKKIKKKYSKELYPLKDDKALAYYKDNINYLSINFLWPIDVQQLHDNR